MSQNHLEFESNANTEEGNCLELDNGNILYVSSVIRYNICAKDNEIDNLTVKAFNTKK